jgi:hypothetical protein
MKKAFTSLAAIVITFNLTAQTYKPAVKLNAGKKYEVVSNVDGMITQEAMGQTMEIPMQTKTTSALTITGTDAKGYQSSYVNDKLTFSMNAMGQDMSYDSDKKEDREGKMGEAMNAMVGKPTTFTVDATGNIIKESVVAPAKEKTEGGDMMSNMMGNMTAGSQSVCPVFDLFSSSKEIKIGESISDSSENNTDGKLKNVTTYTLKEIKDGNAIFTIAGKTEVEKKMEAQGMEMEVKNSTKNTGEMWVNAATGLLVKKTLTMEGNGNVEVQGMTIPTTQKMTTTITVSEK